MSWSEISLDSANFKRLADGISQIMFEELTSIENNAVMKNPSSVIEKMLSTLPDSSLSFLKHTVTLIEENTKSKQEKPMIRLGYDDR